MQLNTKRLVVLASAVIAATFAPSAAAQGSPEKAAMFHKHGLAGDAKREAINIIFSSANDVEKARAKFLLARIAVEENRIQDVTGLWKDIISNHPKTREAELSRLLVEQSGSLLNKGAKDVIDNAVARTYFSAANFWLGQIDRVFRIDTSWLPGEDAALHWLDKIIREFPGTASAEVAYRYRVRAYIGVAGTGRYGLGGTGAWGAASELRAAQRDQAKKRTRAAFNSFMSKAERALSEFEKALPESAYLPRLRFMVAHSYWLVNDKAKADPWLKKILKSAGKKDTFWSHLAQLRLRHWRS